MRADIVVIGAGLWVASGCNGSGFSSSPAIGEALAAWISDGEPPDCLAALSPARFGALTDAELVKHAVWQYAHRSPPRPERTWPGRPPASRF